MGKYVGDDLDFSVGGTSVTCLISVNRDTSLETYDSTCASETDTTFLAGKESDTYTVSFLDAEDEAAWDLFTRGTALACIHYPQGNTSTKPTETFSAFVTGRPREINHKTVTAVTVTLQVTGGVTEGVVA